MPDPVRTEFSRPSGGPLPNDSRAKNSPFLKPEPASTKIQAVSSVPKTLSQQQRPSRVARLAARGRQRLLPGMCLGLAVTPEVAGIVIGYIAQGMMTGGTLAIQYFFKDEVNVGPAQLATIKSLIALPWLIRPVYGLLSDCTPFFGYHRRSYLVASGVLACCAYVTWALKAQTAQVATVLWIAASFCTAMVDVILDGASAEMGRGATQAKAGAFQSLTRLSYAGGGLLVASITGYVIDHIGSRVVILVVGVFSLGACFAACLISDTPGGGEPLPDPSAYKALAPIALELFQDPEKQGVAGDLSSAALPTPDSEEQVRIRRRPRTRMQKILRAMKSSLKQPRVLHPVLFVCLFMATPQTANAMFYFYTKKLASAQFSSRVADVLSALVYAKFFKTVGIRTLFFWAPIMAALLGMTQLILVTGANAALGIPDQWLVLGDTIFIETITRTAMLHLMVLCSNICPAGCESTMFALIMALATGAHMGLGNLGGSMLMVLFGVTSTDFTNLGYLVFTCNILHLTCLPFLCLVPRSVEPGSAARLEYQPRLPRFGCDSQETGQPAGSKLGVGALTAAAAAEAGPDTTAPCNPEDDGAVELIPDTVLGFTRETRMGTRDCCGSQINRQRLQRKLRLIALKETALTSPPSSGATPTGAQNRMGAREWRQKRASLANRPSDGAADELPVSVNVPNIG
eukprot:CAMPEP_0117668706 /NCGR_PEP_ID=MMETSP0804-20121206/11702_1 /TAXON_ID=1074897 /ORGANISM="Tetraselmis astigmatica, Strain CCMP880" /LENGTH=686 /DNA_ID=CAMNT_0005476635 /DNA_START=38 /DNA_END=2099 /DNA_ORIENTATION=+